MNLKKLGFLGMVWSGSHFPPVGFFSTIFGVRNHAGFMTWLAIQSLAGILLHIFTGNSSKFLPNSSLLFYRPIQLFCLSKSFYFPSFSGHRNKDRTILGCLLWKLSSSKPGNRPWPRFQSSRAWACFFMPLFRWLTLLFQWPSKFAGTKAKVFFGWAQEKDKKIITDLALIQWVKKQKLSKMHNGPILLSAFV